MEDFFTRMPNCYVKCDIKQVYGVSRKFYIIYILIDRYRARDGTSWITIKEILDFYGYVYTRKKLKAFDEVLDVLRFMTEKELITITPGLDDINYDTGIKIQIISDNFDVYNKWSKVPFDVVDKILLAKSSVSRENLLLVYLYVSSYIYENDADPRGKQPAAFYRKLSEMKTTISMSSDTINKSLNELVEIGILRKHIVGSTKGKYKAPKNVPNIYVLNKDGYRHEINLALQKMKQDYGVAEFGRFI